MDDMGTSNSNMTTSWDDFFIDRTFTGRRLEMTLLGKELLTRKASAIAIVGGAGMGKTALAMMFGHANKNFFPAGVYHTHATPLETLDATLNGHVSNSSQPYLVILDDLQSRPEANLDSEIRAIRKERPSARLICISRNPALSAEVDFTLQLPGLNQPEFFELLSKAGIHDIDSGAEFFSALSGNPASTRVIADLLQSARISPRDLLQRLRGFTQSGIVDSSGRPIAPGERVDRQIIVDVTSVSNQLLERVHTDPTLMFDLPPRVFEEFVAEVLHRLGYSITLTPATRDGGKDIYAAKKDHLGSFLYVVECKRYAPDNPVGVGLIRQLNGVVQAEQATAGILATTSYFTKDAQEFQRRISHQMGLKDFLGIQEWLSDVFRR